MYIVSVLNVECDGMTTEGEACDVQYLFDVTFDIDLV